MPTIIFTFIGWVMKHWQTVAVGLVVALLGIQTLRVNHANGDLAKTRDALYVPAEKGKPRVKWETAYGQCKTDKDKQQAALDVLKAQGDAIAANVAAAAQAGAAAGARHTEAATRILRAPIPKGDLCKRMLAAEAAAAKEDE